MRKLTMCLAALVLGTTMSWDLAAQSSKVTMHFPFNSQRDTTAVFAAAAKYAKEKTGFDVEFVPYDGFDNYNQKLILQSAAGDPMDLVWTSSWCFNFKDQIAKSAFVPLDDLLAKALPNYYKYVPKLAWDQLRASDGKIYTVPFMEYPARQEAIWFKKDLAEKYKLDVKAVEKDYRAMESFLAAVKKGEPDITPLAVGSNDSVLWHFGSFNPVVTLYNNSVVYKNNPTKVVNSWEQPYLADGLRVANK